jgi:hypothetical protein
MVAIRRATVIAVGQGCPCTRGSGRLGAVLEFNALSRRIAILIVVIALAGAAELYMHEAAAPTCDSAEAQDKLYAVLLNEFRMHNIFVNNVLTTTGGWFDTAQACSAQVTEIRGNVSASAMPWQGVQFSIQRPHLSQPFTMTVTLGGNEPLAAPNPSLWARLLAHL